MTLPGDHWRWRARPSLGTRVNRRKNEMSLGNILIVVLIVFLLGGFSGQFGGYGYGLGNGGISGIGVVLIVVVVLVFTGRL
jgi:hypothetical protein